MAIDSGLQNRMPDIVSIINSVPKNGCSALYRLSDPEYDLHYLTQIQQFLQCSGLSDLEYLGSGSNALVVAPKDTPEFVIRIEKYPGDHRFKIPVMLQTIGEPVRIGAVMEDGNLVGGYQLEFAKRLDMAVSKTEVINFIQQIEPLGYRAMSLARGSEIGWYSYKNAAGESARVLMGADPSSLCGVRNGLNISGIPMPAGYPSLADQYQENLRIASEDKRLEFLLPSIHEQIKSARHCVAVSSDIHSIGTVQTR